MPRLVAFLRAINVGGHTVTMGELCRLFSSAGLKDVETFIASGNVLFSSRVTRTATLERSLGKALESSLGYAVAVFIRNELELVDIHRYRPFPEPEMQRARTVHVGFVAQPPPASTIKAIKGLTTPIDDFDVRGREVYWLCRKGFSESLVPAGRLERVLGAQATFRSLKTIHRLVTKYRLTTADGA